MTWYPRNLQRTLPKPIFLELPLGIQSAGSKVAKMYKNLYGDDRQELY
jgi:hypothetical protein